MLQGEKCRRERNGGGSPEKALGWTVASGQFSLRVVNSAEQLAELDILTRALARFLRRRWRLPRAGGRLRKSENRGDSAQMARSLNRIATIDLRAAKVKKCNRGNITGHGPETALGSSFSSSMAFFPAA